MSRPADSARDSGRQRVRRALDPLTEFLHEEAAGGVALLVGATVAIVWANSPAKDAYSELWHHELRLGAGDLAITADLRHWVNDGLMTVFFFIVGLEIKRELVVGELRERRAATLPAVAALGGVILPALIFLAVTAGREGSSGWAIPAATDIAFAVGVLALLGDRVPAGAKLFLLTVAIVDDIIAIAIIAVVYSNGISFDWLAGAVVAFAVAIAMRRCGVTRIAPFAVVGFVAWIATHESGVHATIAGVVLGLLTPARPIAGRAILELLEHRLHPISAFVIVPLFALANVGIGFGGGALGDAATSHISWAIAAGLVLGKLLGITGATFLTLRLGWGELPPDVDRTRVWGIAALGGIGFTVSLFIAQLAYDAPQLIDTAKIGIFAGSLASGTLGALILARRGAA